MQEGNIYFTVKEVAEKLGVSSRWLADQCRDGEVEHVHIARKRRFTPQQVELLLAKHTVRPEKVTRTEAARDRVVRTLARRGTRL